MIFQEREIRLLLALEAVVRLWSEEKACDSDVHKALGDLDAARGPRCESPFCELPAGHEGCHAGGGGAHGGSVLLVTAGPFKARP